MNILSLEEISKRYRETPLFEAVTFGLDSNEKVGIIGANGSGKSTLLRIIARLEEPDTGRVSLTRECAVAYLPQNPQFNPDQTVLDAVFAGGNETLRLLGQYEAACHDLAHGQGQEARLMGRVAALSQELDIRNGWDVENDARTVLTQLGIPDVAMKMAAASGGQAKRVGLAHTLILRPDLLILDEPTNQLDADTITWLEDYLARYTGALLLVTHDRYFLDRVSTRILEIDRRQIRSFAGNYEFYLKRKEELDAERANLAAKHKSMLRRDLAWLARGARARRTKEKARVERVEALKRQPIESAPRELEISLGSERLGKKILELEGVSKAYGDKKIIEDFSYTLKAGDRIGIIGPNGSGKTTLLDIITGRVKPDRGQVEIGQTVVIGYYDQEARELNEHQRVIDYIREVAEEITLADGTRVNAGQMLEQFLFPPSVQWDVIGRLSGGERRRLYLLRTLMASPNVLLLDEPTNDLDIPTLVRVEDFLDSFPGCLMVVSHDRFFLDRTADHIFRFEGDGRIGGYTGNYSEFLDSRAAAQSALRGGPSSPSSAGFAARAKATPTDPGGNEENRKSQADNGGQPTRRKLSFKEKRELEELETRIASSEDRLFQIKKDLEAAASDYVVLQTLTSEMQLLEAQLEVDVDRWAKLSELA
jgi:ABC transport system ATP-binding/permease protein